MPKMPKNKIGGITCRGENKIASAYAAALVLVGIGVCPGCEPNIGNRVADIACSQGASNKDRANEIGDYFEKCFADGMMLAKYKKDKLLPLVKAVRRAAGIRK
jgi:hypothetical protein